MRLYVTYYIFKCQVSIQANQSSNVSMVPLPILVILQHHWWSSHSPCNPKYHLCLSCPCMRQCYCSHKGMGIDIHCWVNHFHAYKMFFQVLYLSSSVHHLQVLFGNLLLHLSVLVCCVLVCCLDPGHGTSVKVQNGWLVYDPTSIPRQLRFSLYSGAVITEGMMQYYYFFIVVLVLDLVLCPIHGFQLPSACVVHCLDCSLTQHSPLLCFSGFTGFSWSSYPWGVWLPFYLGCSPLNSGIACLAYLNPGIACLASQSSDWLSALWASLSGLQSSMTFVRLNVIGCCQSGMFNCPASSCWLINLCSGTLLQWPQDSQWQA